MSIDWPSEEEAPRPARRSPAPWPPTAAELMFIEDGALPSGRKPREVAVIVAIAALLILAGILLWFFVGPLPRVFPLIS
jgi:hypothetical protein